MAKKTKEPKKVLERTYNVPLRSEWLKVPRYKRAKKAAKALREFIIKHMKPGLDEKGKINVKILSFANKELWKHGIKNPPHHIKVTSVKDEKGKVLVELEGKPLEEQKPTEEKEEKKKEIEKEKQTKKAEKEELQEAKKEPETLEKNIPEKEVKQTPEQKGTEKAPKAQQAIARGEHKEK